MNWCLILTLLIAACPNPASGQWTIVGSGTTNNLLQIVFPDTSTGYIITDKPSDTTSNAMVLKTVDGGYTWTPVLYKRNRLFAGIDFLSADTGVVVSATSFDTCYITTNGGVNWTKKKMQHDIGNLFHMNSSEEWIYLRGQHWGHTEDAGTTWVDSTFGNSGLLPIITCDFQFLNDNTAIGFGWYGTSVFRSNNGGLNWPVLLSNPPSSSIQSGCFPTSATGYYVSNQLGSVSSYQVLKTTDGGTNWTQVNSANGFRANCIRYIDENRLYVVGDSGYVTRSVDGGNMWVQDISGTVQNLNKIVILPGKAIAIGDSGTILINRSIPTSVKEQAKESATISVLPNPSTGKFTFQPGRLISPPFNLAVFSDIGQLVLSMPSSQANIEIDLANQKNGIFYYVLTTDTQVFRGNILKMN